MIEMSILKDALYDSYLVGHNFVNSLGILGNQESLSTIIIYIFINIEIAIALYLEITFTVTII